MTAASEFAPGLMLSYDVGGSHVRVGLCDPIALRVLRTASAPLPQELTAKEFVHLLYDLAQQVQKGCESTVLGAALAFPGPFDFEAGISQMRHKLRSLYGVNLRQELAAQFAWPADRFHFLLDSGAFLLGELAAGAAKGADRAVGIVLGTGVGSAFAQGGRWVTSGEGVPPGGEIWNLPFAGGIVEDLLSTRALKQGYERHTGRTEEVVTLAAKAASDPDARNVFEEFGAHFGQIAREILSAFGPDLIVVGGGIARSADLFFPAAEPYVSGFGARLVASSLGDAAPLLGAASFWRERVREQSGRVPGISGDATQ
ncbi:MAG: ROK family protein [Terracidiphilus sp.]